MLPKLIQLWRAGATIEILQHPSARNHECIILKVTSTTADGIYTFALDQNYKVTSYTHTTHDQQTTQTQLSHYEQVDGLYLPMHQKIHAEQTGRSIMTTEAIVIGVEIYEDYFTSATIK